MPPTASVPRIQVAAAVLRDRQGRVLVADRPAGKPMAGFWEFPGGKLEPGEQPFDALRRELREELGIQVRAAYRLLRFTHLYPEREVELDVWRVTAWDGEPAAHEGQRLVWHRPRDLMGIGLLPADEPIVRVLELPPLMLVTPSPEDDEVFLRRLQRSLDAGVDWVQFRAPWMDAARYGGLAERVVAACRSAGAQVSLHGDAALARELGADGAHLGQKDMDAYDGRDGGLRLGISCHTLEELRRALELKPAYLTLGPVRETASHPEAKPLGWERFRPIAAASPVPVYAIGGLSPADLVAAREHGAYGLAAIRTLWDIGQLSASS